MKSFEYQWEREHTYLIMIEAFWAIVCCPLLWLAQTDVQRMVIFFSAFIVAILVLVRATVLFLRQLPGRDR